MKSPGLDITENRAGRDRTRSPRPSPCPKAGAALQLSFLTNVSLTYS